MNRVVHFEIHASTPQSLITFYSELFGWSFKQWGGAEYWLIETGAAGEPGINGALLQRRGPAPAAMQSVNSFVCTVEVGSLDHCLSKGTARGGTVAVPKMPVPGVGWLAYLKDPDGNIFGILQPDRKAV